MYRNCPFSFYGGFTLHRGGVLFLFQPVSVLNIWVISNPFIDDKLNNNKKFSSNVVPLLKTLYGFPWPAKSRCPGRSNVPNNLLPQLVLPLPTLDPV